ncbi:ankyrin repeat, SAM and basic leucine zipper domain-containing protein 1 [Notolabrus celidotus]|uniref:ankyrin repeat, SAM and basic leucine zipper domain-containing protein 1 n=1 Tax=Notolabrus celidotus TaxID=1203425 RepID=UPI00148FFF93|nr:ankyrin repeat, SAM and basic leucine zipper domain-containing protein 1 [Notolabrus celidotus]
MGSYTDNAYPAGDESDASDDEWDIGSCLGKKASRKTDLDAVVPQAEDNVSMLKRAISAGNIDAVEQLLDNGMDVETRLGYEWTPLMCAVNVANYDLAKLLLDRGASANFSKDNWTVLMASCGASASEDKLARCVELLLSRNADPNMVDRSHMTCLMLAGRDGHSKVLNLLVSHGAEINTQDNNGYTALALAVQYGREEAVLKLLQLGADKTIRTKAGKSPADLAVTFKHTQIGRILASSSHISAVHAFSSTEETLSKFFKTNSEPTPSKESFTKLDELELFLHGLDLGYLADIMTENDITWSYLLTMEKEDLEKIGIKDPADQKKVLSAVQQMHLDKVDLDTIGHLEAADSGSEELHNFLISVRQQCCYLTETVQDTVSRFPRHASQLVFSLDPKKEAQAVCNQLIVQTKDLQKEVICLRNLLCQTEETEDSHHIPRHGSHSNWRMRSFTGVALSVLGASFLVLLFKAEGGKVLLSPFRLNI